VSEVVESTKGGLTRCVPGLWGSRCGVGVENARCETRSPFKRSLASRRRRSRSSISSWMVWGCDGSTPLCIDIALTAADSGMPQERNKAERRYLRRGGRP
jgi:hypothetical protein